MKRNGSRYKLAGSYNNMSIDDNCTSVLNDFDILLKGIYLDYAENAFLYISSSKEDLNRETLIINKIINLWMNIFPKKNISFEITLNEFNVLIKNKDDNCRYSAEI